MPLKITKALRSAVLILFIFTATSFGATISSQISKKQPLNITSDKVEIIRNKNEIIFINNVKAVQEKFTLYANKMIVKYKEVPDKKIEIQTIKTEKNVRFITDKIVATGSEGFYNVSKNLITLKNDVKATESGITVIAEEFEYDIATGKTKIIGNKKQNERVTIILDNVDNIKK